MAEILGEFFEAGAGRSVLGRFRVDVSEQVFMLTADGEIYDGPLSALTIEPPLGRQPRKIYLPGGHLFQTDERDALAAALPKTGWSFVAALEKFGPHLLPIAIATPFLAYGLYRLLMPFFVNVALSLTPTAVVYQMDKSTMATLDRFVTKESSLPEARRAELSAVFDDLVQEGASDRAQRPPKYKLLFRGGRMGPNAFALPGGTIVITDDLVEMFPDDLDVLAGVLGHEIGHVEMEHSLKRLYRAVGVATMVSLMAGDAGPMVEDVLLEGGALLSLSFSRHQETQSDNFAVDLMHDIGRNPEAMAKFFEEIEKLQSFRGLKDGARDDAAGGAGSDVDGATQEPGQTPDKDAPASDDNAADTAPPKINMEWVSTHPLSEKRIENIRKRAADLRNQ